MRRNLFRSTLPSPSIRCKSSSIPVFIIATASHTRVYVFSGRWPAFFLRNSVLARELREYNNSRGWSYLLARNSAAKNRPHRGVNINASLGGWRDAVWNGFVGGRVENCGGWQDWKRVERQVVYASGAWTLSFGIVTSAQVKKRCLFHNWRTPTFESVSPLMLSFATRN